MFYKLSLGIILCNLLILSDPLFAQSQNSAENEIGSLVKYCPIISNIVDANPKYPERKSLNNSYQQLVNDRNILFEQEKAKHQYSFEKKTDGEVLFKCNTEVIKGKIFNFTDFQAFSDVACFLATNSNSPRFRMHAYESGEDTTTYSYFSLFIFQAGKINSLALPRNVNIKNVFLTSTGKSIIIRAEILVFDNNNLIGGTACENAFFIYDINSKKLFPLWFVNFSDQDTMSMNISNISTDESIYIECLVLGNYSSPKMIIQLKKGKQNVLIPLISTP